MEDNTREGRSRRMRRLAVGFFQSMTGKNNFLVKFQDRKKIDMSSCSIFYVCLKEEVAQELDETISGLPKNNRVNY